ncbi:hypothetical protein [Haladaptatus sp. DYF46]|uniref:hypothetical protein n=1 Tax=Haladaptatus sp. DYF46 TaxID=2886041 RepID=UPI001E4887A5|nr:hypothetical protein [Haladaptatus sp. DYF46]
MGETLVKIQLVAGDFAVAHLFCTFPDTNLVCSPFGDNKNSDKKVVITRQEEAK